MGHEAGQDGYGKSGALLGFEPRTFQAIASRYFDDTIGCHLRTFKYAVNYKNVFCGCQPCQVGKNISETTASLIMRDVIMETRVLSDRLFCFCSHNYV